MATVRWLTKRGRRETALVIDCEKWANCIVIDSPIKVYTMDKREALHLDEVMHKGEPYPIRQSINKYIESAERLGITAGARRIIGAVTDGEIEIEDVKPSENQWADKPFAVSSLNPATLPAVPVAKAEPEPKPVRARPTGREVVRKALSVSPKGVKSNAVRTLADENGVDTSEIRKALRKAGLRAPYTDLASCRAAIKGKLK